MPADQELVPVAGQPARGHCGPVAGQKNSSQPKAKLGKHASPSGTQRVLSLLPTKDSASSLMKCEKETNAREPGCCVPDADPSSQDQELLSGTQCRHLHFR